MMFRVRHVIGTSAATFVSGGLGLLTAVLAARMLSPADNGQYAQYLVVMNLAFIAVNLGIGPSSTYHIAAGAWSVTAAIRLNVVFCAAATALLATACGLVIGTSLGATIGSMFKIEPSQLLLGLVSGAALLAVTQASALLQGQHDFVRMNWLAVLRAALPLALIAASAVFQPDAVVVSATHAFGLGGAVILGACMLNWSGVAVQRVGAKQLESLVAYGGVAYLSNLMHHLATRGLLVFLSFYALPQQVGFFNLALLLVEAALLLPSSMGQLVFAQATSAQFDPRKLEAALRLNILFAAVLAAVMLTARPVITWILGSQYAEVGMVLGHLTPTIVLLSVPRILSQLLSGRGRPQWPLLAAVISTIIGAGLATWWIPVHGLVGAAWVSNVVALITAAVTLLGYRQLQGSLTVRAVVPTQADVQALYAALQQWRRG